MADNVLKATIKIDTQGVNSAFQNTASQATRTKVSLQGTDQIVSDITKNSRNLTDALNKLGSQGLLSFNSLETSIRDFRDLARDATDPKQIRQYGDAITALVAKQKELADTALGTNNATAALQKGFGVIRQLAFILPGIGIAGIFNLIFEGITKLASVINDQLSGSVNVLGEFNDKLAEIAGSSVAPLELLRAKLNDSNTTFSQRVELIKDFNREADKQNQLDVAQAGNLDLINSKIQAQIELLKQRAAVRAAEGIIAQKFEKLFDLQLSFDTSFPDLEKNRADIIAKATSLVNSANEKLKITPTFDTKELLALSSLPQEALNKLAQTGDRLKALGNPQVVASLRNLNTQLKSSIALTKNLGQAGIFEGFERDIAKAQKDVDDTLALFGKILTVPGFSEPVKEKLAKEFEAIKVGIVDGLNDLVQLIETPHVFSLPFKVILDETNVLSTLQFSQLQKNLQDKLNQFALRASSVPTHIKELIQIDPNIAIPKDVRNDIEKQLKSIFPTGAPLQFEDIEVDGKVVVNAKLDLKEITRQFNQQIADTVHNLQTNIATSIGEAIGNALTGTGDAKDAFAAVFNFLADGIKAIGVALIKIGALSEGIQKALASLSIQPELAIALGIAFVALSQVLKNNFNPRAKGGPVNRGQIYQVNEQGQELFQPNSGGAFLIQGPRQLFTPPTSGKIMPHWETEKILKGLSGSGRMNANFNSMIGKIAGYRAGGGTVISGNNYVVNENGAEIFIPNTGQSIRVATPKGLVKNGGMTINITGEFIQRGKDLRAVLSATDISQRGLI